MFVAPIPAAPAHGLSQLAINVLLELHSGEVANHHRDQVDGGGGVRVAAAGLAPHGDRISLARHLSGGHPVDDGDPAIRAFGVERHLFAVHQAGIVAANAGCHGKQLTELDPGFPRIAEREDPGRQVSRGEYLLVEAFGEQFRPLVHQDASGDAGIGLAH